MSTHYYNYHHGWMSKVHDGEKTINCVISIEATDAAERTNANFRNRLDPEIQIHIQNLKFLL